MNNMYDEERETSYANAFQSHGHDKLKWGITQNVIAQETLFLFFFIHSIRFCF